MVIFTSTTPYLLWELIFATNLVPGRDHLLVCPGHGAIGVWFFMSELEVRGLQDIDELFAA